MLTKANLVPRALFPAREKRLHESGLQRLLDKTREISLKVTQNKIEERGALLCSHLCSVYCYLCI